MYYKEHVSPAAIFRYITKTLQSFLTLCLCMDNVSGFFLTMLPHIMRPMHHSFCFFSFRLFLLDFMHYRTGTTTILTSYISLHVTIKRLTTAFRSITPWTLRNFMSIGCHQKKFTYIGKTHLRNSTEESALRWAFENQWVSYPILLYANPKLFSFQPWPSMF